MLQYHFKEITGCNMCKAPASRFKYLGVRLNQSQGLKPKKKHGVSTAIMKCKDCGLIFSNPQPLPESIAAQYNLSPEEFWQGGDFSWNENYFAKEIATAKKLLHTKDASPKALDIGAGYGRCMLSLKHYGFDAYGFEPSTPFYNLALDKFKIDPSRIKLATIEETDYEENFFDFITFGAVVEHLHDPDACIAKAVRWLKPGGIIHIEVPSSNWFIARLLNFYYKHIARTAYVTHISPMHAPFHHFEFTKESFQKNGAINNYDVTEASVEVCETTLPVKWFDPLFKKMMKRNNTGMQLVVYLRKNG